MVSVWATANCLMLGQHKVDAKSNEITAIPQLIKVLELEGRIVTIDAMECQKQVANQIIERKADYVLTRRSRSDRRSSSNNASCLGSELASITLFFRSEQLWLDVDFQI